MIKYALMSLAFPMENIPIEVLGMLTFTEFGQSQKELRIKGTADIANK